MKRLVLLAVLLAAPAAARTSLGTYDGWGAFRDERPFRCFAIAEPEQRRQAQWRPFASVASWPQARARGQVHIRLRREKLAAARVTLRVGSQRFEMLAGRADAWAPDARTDAAIVTAMRGAPSMTITTRATTGSAFSDTYRLKGAATAIDAASLGCARR